MRDNKKKGNAQNFDKKNDKRMKNNYFTGCVKRDGENFLDNANPQQLKKDALRIFREVLMGKIDLAENAVYFANSSLSIALINYSYERYIECNNVTSCMDYYINAYNSMGMTVDPSYIETAEKFRDLRNIYNIINVNLNSFKYTCDTGYLIAMGNALRPYGRKAYMLY